MALEGNELTVLLNAWMRGEEDACESALKLVYNKLKGLAKKERARDFNAALLTTDLLHEAFQDLNKMQDEQTKEPMQFKSRQHFYHTAARVMRRLLIDDARKRYALKRGGNDPHRDVELDDIQVQTDPLTLIAIDHALKKLESVDELAARVVEYKYFIGFTNQEAANALGASRATVERKWAFAKAFLFNIIKDSGA